MSDDNNNQTTTPTASDDNNIGILPPILKTDKESDVFPFSSNVSPDPSDESILQRNHVSDLTQVQAQVSNLTPQVKNQPPAPSIASQVSARGLDPKPLISTTSAVSNMISVSLTNSVPPSTPATNASAPSV